MGVTPLPQTSAKLRVRRAMRAVRPAQAAMSAVGPTSQGSAWPVESLQTLNSRHRVVLKADSLQVAPRKQALLRHLMKISSRRPSNRSNRRVPRGSRLKIWRRLEARNGPSWKKSSVNSRSRPTPTPKNAWLVSSRRGKNSALSLINSRKISKRCITVRFAILRT